MVGIAMFRAVTILFEAVAVARDTITGARCVW
jgi:hypothetical protein